MNVVRSALLLSLVLHGVIGWWVFQTDEFARLLKPQPTVSGLRLQVTTRSVVVPTELPTSSPTPYLERQIKTERSNAQPLPAGLQTPLLQAVQAGARALGSSVAPNLTPSTVLESSLEVQPKLELNLRSAAQAVEHLRSKSPLATAIDAQQMQTGAAKMASVFSKLGSTTSNIVEETVMADGGRMTRFSGGGCMRMPNPSSRSYDDVRKPAMETC